MLCYSIFLHDYLSCSLVFNYHACLILTYALIGSSWSCAVTKYKWCACGLLDHSLQSTNGQLVFFLHAMVESVEIGALCLSPTLEKKQLANHLPGQTWDPSRWGGACLVGHNRPLTVETVKPSWRSRLNATRKMSPWCIFFSRISYKKFKFLSD